MNKADVVVIGAGPAGSSAAYFLAKQGVDVLLIDKSTFPREKTCGDGLGPRAIEVLDRMGLADWLATGGYTRCDRVRLFSGNGHYFEARIPDGDTRYPHFYIVQRSDLDQKLIEAASGAGARVRTGCKAVAPIWVDGAVTGLKAVCDGEPIEFSCKALVCADGTSGTFSQYTGIRIVKPYAFAVRAYYSGVRGLDDCINVFADKRIPQGYGWVFPHSDGRANIGVGMSTPMLKGRGIDARELLTWFVRSKAMGPIDARRAVQDSDIKGAFLRMGFGRHDVVADGILLVGDSAGLVSPLSGEGVPYALESGEQAAYVLKRALDAGDTSARALKPYHSYLNQQFLSVHRQCEAMRESLSFSRNIFMDWFVRRGIKHPHLAGKFVSVMLSTAPPTALLDPKLLPYYLI